jgi:hypothetical protein
VGGKGKAFKMYLKHGPLLVSGCVEKERGGCDARPVPERLHEGVVLLRPSHFVSVHVIKELWFCSRERI